MLKPERKNTWVSAQHLSSSLFLVEDPLVGGIHGLGKEIKGREVGTHWGCQDLFLTRADSAPG